MFGNSIDSRLVVADLEIRGVTASSFCSVYVYSKNFKHFINMNQSSCCGWNGMLISACARKILFHMFKKVPGCIVNCKLSIK